VHKYVALANTLLAETAMARGDFETADTQMAAAVEELERFPVPLIAWKAHAMRGRLYSKLGKSVAAEQAYVAATTVARQIAECIDDFDLRQRFQIFVSRSLGATIS
jgi:Tfp pilus assembly protein PilF